MKHLLFLILILFLNTQLQAQLEKIIVETYYITDSTEAADTIHGKLETGSTTYRIYVDLQPGYKIKKIFGNTGYPLKIASTSSFFNNLETGVSFGKDMNKNDLGSNTTALDTWLTLGVAAKRNSNSFYPGILKSQDKDGSIIGGTNNDSAYLANQNPLAGVPLTDADGLAKSGTIPSNIWVSGGILDASELYDSTIFGSLSSKKEFNSNGQEIFFANPKGISGSNADSNQVLIAQLTTKGKLSFQLNFEIADANDKPIYLVASGKDHTTDSIVKFSPFLTYPASCGCTDPHYLEYSPSFVCENAVACKTRIVCGCMDSLACNYDPNANVNISGLCCYPGLCSERDIDIVCPSISNAVHLSLYPNPVADYLSIQFTVNREEPIKYAIYDAYGLVKLEKNNIRLTGTMTEQVDVSDFSSGLYWVRLTIGDTILNQKFMKK